MAILHRLLYLLKQFELKIGLTNERLPASRVTFTAQQLAREKTWTVALALVFILHNAEEAFTETSLHGTLLQTYTSNSLTGGEHLLASSIMSLLFLGWVLIAFRSRQLVHVSGINTALAGVLLFNALVPHLVLFLLQRQYTPGIITVLAGNIPLGIAQLLHQRRLQTLALPQLVKCLWAGLIVGLFSMTLALSLSKIIL